MLGAIIGDIVGSRFEFNNIKTKKFKLFDKRCKVTDDSVMSVAVAEMCLNGYVPNNKEMIIKTFKKWGQKYPRVGYGNKFFQWVLSDNPLPYNSCGNGSAMRISAIGFFAKTKEEVEVYSKDVTEVTHNHPEGIKGAESVASVIWLCRKGKSKDEIKTFIQNEFGYDLSRTCNQIRSEYTFDVSCQGTVPQAITAFLEGCDFEDVIRTAVSLGGDSDTLTCIAGSMAEAFYGVPQNLKQKCLELTTSQMHDVIKNFEFFCKH